MTKVGTLQNLTVSGSATFTGTVTVPAPTTGTHAVNRDFATSNFAVTAGTGLTKTGGRLSLDAASITSVGTLTGLTVSGDATFSGAVNVPAPTAGTHAATRDYADSLVVTAGTGLTKTGNTLALDAASITSVGWRMTEKSSPQKGSAFVGAIVTPMEYFAPMDEDTVAARDASPGVIVNPARAIGALTIVLPGTPVNGQRFSVHSTQDIAALTLTATFAPGNAPGAGMTAGTALKWTYSDDIGGWLNA